MIPLDNGDEMHTIPSAARAFGVTERTIRRWIDRGEIPVLHGYVSYLALAASEHEAKAAKDATLARSA